MLDRVFRVSGPNGDQFYTGFDQFQVGAFYQLSIGECTFYCNERDLALAICEVARYGKEQYDWEPPVSVTPLPPALESYNF